MNLRNHHEVEKYLNYKLTINFRIRWKTMKLRNLHEFEELMKILRITVSLRKKFEFEK